MGFFNKRKDKTISEPVGKDAADLFTERDKALEEADNSAMAQRVLSYGKLKSPACETATATPTPKAANTAMSVKDALATAKGEFTVAERMRQANDAAKIRAEKQKEEKMNMETIANMVSSRKNEATLDTGSKVRTVASEKSIQQAKQNEEIGMSKLNSITDGYKNKGFISEVKPVAKKQIKSNGTDVDINSLTAGYKNKNILTEVKKKNPEVKRTNKDEVDDLENVSRLVSGYMNANVRGDETAQEESADGDSAETEGGR